MDWHDEGILLAARRHGESALILEVFTARHGRHAGVVPGGASRRRAADFQPGGDLGLEWRARLEEHIGTFRAEPLRPRPGVMNDRLGLLGLNALCAMLLRLLPEREPLPALHARTRTLLDAIEAGASWPEDYVRWEADLLAALGYGLALDRCALGGETGDLAFVSPRSGRAVSAGAAGVWAERLLTLPRCLGGRQILNDEASAGLRVTGYFLERRLLPDLGLTALPAARLRLVEALERAGR